MKRILVVLLALALAGSLLSGCAKKAADKVTLRVLHYIDATTPSYSVHQWMFQTFRDNNPDIKLELEELFDEAYHTKVEAYAAAGRLPDVLFMFPSGRSSTLYTRKLVKDLVPFMAPLASQFIPMASQPGQYGILGQIPQSTTNTHVLFANVGLLRQLGLSEPRTYEDLVAMVPAARAAGKEVILIPAKADWVLQSCLFSMVLGRMGGDRFIDDLLAGRARFTDPIFVDTLAFIQRLFTDGVIGRSSLQVDYGEGPALFAGDRTLFYIDGDWRVGEFITDPNSGVALIPPAKQTADFKLVNFPRIPGERVANSSSIVAGTGYGIGAHVASGSALEEAAWRLITWLNSAEVLSRRLSSGDFANTTRLGVTADNLEPLQRMNAALVPSTGTYVVDGILDAAVCAPINIGLQELALGMTTPQAVAAAAQAALEDWRKTQP